MENCRRLIISFFLICLGAPAQDAIDLCTAIKSGVSRTVTVRGFAQIRKKVPILFDQTCPIEETGAFSLPSMIEVLLSGTQDDDIHRSFGERLSRAKSSTLFALVVRGDLRCQADFRFRRSDDGEIVEA